MGLDPFLVFEKNSRRVAHPSRSESSGLTNHLTKYRQVTEGRTGGISFLSKRTLIPIFGARIEW